MEKPWRDLFGDHRSSARFVSGVALIGLGDTAISAMLTHDTSPLFTLETLATRFLCVSAWNLTIILLFFHRPLRRELINRQWIHARHHALNNQLRDAGTLPTLGEKTLTFLLEHLNALNGVIYLSGEENRLHRLAGIGTPPASPLSQTLAPGEGLLGQVALTRKMAKLTDPPIDALRIRTELLETGPREVIVTPLIHDDHLHGVIALGSHTPFEKRHLRFLEKAGETIAHAIAGVRLQAARHQLLEESRQKTQELAINQQVLRGTIQLLEQSSGFKSRFLANMSHELRSPLNSLLILARLLQENKQGNLTPKQVEFATTIHAAGSDLLHLIDEILDLARIEAGKIRLYQEPVKLTDLATSLNRLFTHVAQEKKLHFAVILKEPLPVTIHTDRMRLEQILKNLITNAIKFTHAGGVTVTFHRNTESAQARIALSVADTGIGIPREQHSEVFEPFLQLDDGSNRKYGGSGLGLAICKELGQLLGGHIELVSDVNKGSLFTLWLPLPDPADSSALAPNPPHGDPGMTGKVDGIPDDRRRLGPDDRAILLVGMDYHRIRALGETARALGLGVIVAGDQSAALFLANFLNPVGLVMAGDLPGVATLPLLNRLRTTTNRNTLPALYLHPANASPEWPLSDHTIELVPMLHESGHISEACRRFLQTVAETAVTPGTPAPPLPGSMASTPRPLPLPAFRTPDVNLAERHILLIDDDIRNIFALTSLLEEQRCQVIMAENGTVALDRLRAHPLPDMILLDIMLPDMNGYELLQTIRCQPAWREIPILVLTTKAMQGERQRCLESGASDYLSKPVDPLKLLSMMHPWLDKNR